ncbi:MAG TPA: addiction module protein, partial [Kiloniellales bacterium]|nr:addiction module protein [Kiloniellales bacterium]
ERGNKLLAEALQLTPEERAEFAVELIASIDGPADPNADAAWAAEIERRARRVLDGTSAGQDWDEVRQRIERRLS